MQPNKNALLLRALCTQADTLSCGVAKNEFPVLLQPLASRRRITSVQFQPLLVDAMLVTHPQGFRIVFNSGGEDPVKLTNHFRDESRANPMPSRLRFSLAHELAHTLFYDLSADTPQVARQFRSGGGRTALDNLERNCNKLAAHLLLPTPMLDSAFRKLAEVKPEPLLDMADAAGVSVEVLVRRLADQNSVFTSRYFRGCIILASRRGTELRVVAVAKPKGLNIARDLRLLRPGERWQVAVSGGAQISPEDLPRESTLSLTVETPRGVKSEHNYRVAVAQMSRSEFGATFLLTFEEMEAV